MSLAMLLTGLTDHEDSPYYILLIVPILQAAFRLSLPAVIGIVAISDTLNFYWVALYFRRHPPVDVAEYFEAALTSLIFAVVGVLVWILVNHLREKEAYLATNLAELERTRGRLLQEETLAAVGRLSSAIAHEIRNPVAMISSSLARAKEKDLELEQRMPDGDGLEVLSAAREADPAMSVVFLTAVATIELAVESMRRGAFDFLTKPFQPEVVRAAANRAAQNARLLRENTLLKGTVIRLEGSP